MSHNLEPIPANDSWKKKTRAMEMEMYKAHEKFPMSIPHVNKRIN